MTTSTATSTTGSSISETTLTASSSLTTTTSMTGTSTATSVTEAVISGTEGLYGHWDASVSSSLDMDGSAVARWSDLSANGVDVMAPERNGPSLVSNAIN